MPNYQFSYNQQKSWPKSIFVKVYIFYDRMKALLKLSNTDTHLHTVMSTYNVNELTN